MQVFFKGTLKTIHEELEEIDVSAYQIDLGEVLPGEEIIDEMNEFEKKIVIWIQLTELEIRKFHPETRDDEFYADRRNSDQLMIEMKMIKAKFDYVIHNLARSVWERNKTIANIGFRGNFQIVTNAKQEKETEQMKQAAIIGFLNWEGTGTGKLH